MRKPLKALTLSVRLKPTLALALIGATFAWGQNAISARSGMIHYAEGRVLVDGQLVEPKATEFPEVKIDQVLATEEGRAEVLLTPGVFLRLSEDSSFRMISNRLSDTSFEVVSGDVLIEVMELLKDNSITVQFKDLTARVSKRGLYRLDADKGTVRVFDGQIILTSGELNLVVRKGKEVAVGDSLQATNFNPKDTDPFYRWAARRSEYIATANVSAAQQAGSMGLVANGPTSWAYNPNYGMFTYLPGTGYGYSPFGWAFYSPLTVGNYYNSFNGSNGGFYNTAGAGTRVAPTAVRSPPTQRGVDTASASSLLSGAERSGSSGSTGISGVAAHGPSAGGHK
jgi:hypothetical protein